MIAWLKRIWHGFRPGAVEDDIHRELAFHRAERIDELRAEGLSEADATRLARRQIGHPGVQAERVRDVDVAAWADTLRRNLRLACRSLARTPGFTVTVVLTLALGIGANSAVFTALDAVLLQPLPVALACVGIYGTLNGVVAARRREVGLRLALGAMRGAILRQFLARSLRVVAAASLAGVGLSLASTRVLSGMLYGVSPTDPATLAGVVGLVLTVATLAALVPAARAALTEPMQVLRDE